MHLQTNLRHILHTKNREATKLQQLIGHVGAEARNYLRSQDGPNFEWHLRWSSTTKVESLSLSNEFRNRRGEIAEESYELV